MTRAALCVALSCGAASLCVPCLTATDSSGPVLSSEAKTPRIQRDIETDTWLADVAAHGPQSQALAFARGGQVVVLLAVQVDATPQVARSIEEWGGTIEYRDDQIGYLRVRVPPERVLVLERMSPVDALHVDGTLALYNWIDPRRLPATPRQNTPKSDNQKSPRDGDRSNRPSMAQVSQAAAMSKPLATNYTLGLDVLRQAHPTFDGRGTTIALIESSGLDLRTPDMASALTLDGRPIPKLAGVIASADSPFRVPAIHHVQSSETTAWIDRREYRLPHAGHFAFGRLDLSGMSFPTLWETATATVWVDLNQNDDFSDDAPLRDPRQHVSMAPDEATVPGDVAWGGGRFYVTIGTGETFVDVHPIRAGHLALTASIAAGMTDQGSLALGAAPGARVVVVDVPDDRAHGVLEGMIAAAQHPEVDVISASMPSVVSTPATNNTLATVLLDRMSRTYGKAVVTLAGNMGAPEQVYPSGRLTGISVGAYSNKEVASAFFNNAPSLDQWVPNYSGSGPRPTGGGGPDVLAPAQHIIAASCNREGPKLAGAQLPACYDISGGTYGATPAIAGSVAVLISAARQSGLTLTPARIRWALKESAMPIPGVGPAEQGAGRPQIDRAWELLRAPSSSLPEILVESPAPVHTLSAYFGVGESSNGDVYEREGWTVGNTGVRTLTFERRSGPSGVVRYNLDLVGDTQTFRVPRSIALPLGKRVALPITIQARTAGPQSARLLLRQASDHFTVLERQLAIVVADRFASHTGFTVRYAGSLGDADRIERAFVVPQGTTFLRMRFAIAANTFLWLHEPGGWRYHRQNVRPFLASKWRDGPGDEEFVIPDPTPGTWVVMLARPDRGRFDPSSYSLEIGSCAMDATQAASAPSRGVVVVDWRTRHADLSAKVSPELGWRESLTSKASDLGWAKVADVHVADHTSSLQVRATSASSTFTMYLYECTSGTCLRYDAGVPRAEKQVIQLVHPKSGLWKVVVIPGPSSRAQEIEIDTIVSRSDLGVASLGEQSRPERLSDSVRRTMEVGIACDPTRSDRTPVLLLHPGVEGGLHEGSDKRSVRTAEQPDEAGKIAPAAIVLPLTADVCKGIGRGDTDVSK